RADHLSLLNPSRAHGVLLRGQKGAAHPRLASRVESMKRYLIAAALFAATASPAAAYTGFLLPQDFWPSGTTANVQASYAQQFFTPSVALGGDFQVVDPSGQSGVLSGVEVGANATALAVETPEAGTYLLTTGEQLGRVTTLVGTPD